jgi:hypothetical protein
VNPAGAVVPGGVGGECLHLRHESSMTGP